jgi:hypothetical protein
LESEYVGVVPDGTADPQMRFSDGRTKTLAVGARGVVVAVTREHATVSLQAPGHATVRADLGPEPEGRLVQDCGDGRVIEVEQVSSANC